VKRLSMAFPVIFIAFITTIAQAEDLGRSPWWADNLVIQITEDGKFKNEVWVADLYVFHNKNKRSGAVWSYSVFHPLLAPGRLPISFLWK